MKYGSVYRNKCSMEKQNIFKALAYLLTALGTALLIAVGLQSCKAVRVYSTVANCVKSSDTTTISVTNTETYKSFKTNGK